ncbi:MAG: aldolase catalytic domain-containing protein [Treponema sp.]|nr:aldolase catalytic domain-containing protein [Treponema sp.]
MISPLLLDCTLRDGGFVNDWNFGIGSIKSIISRLDYAGVDIIEIGFIDERRAYDENRSIFPDTESIKKIFESIQKPSAIIVGMIDYGTCSINKVSNKDDSCLDGIRVIFKKEDQEEAIDFLKQIKDKGYKIFANPVSITSYTNDEVSILIEKLNKIKPYAVSIVDTYGLMHSKELLNYFDIFNSKLDKNIILGYHAHNNFQMAYANSITLMNKSLERRLAIDSSLFGMGKSAGNVCTELLAMYMNEFFERNFNIHQIQEAIDVDILKEHDKKYWGYNFEYYIAALNDCHPSYVQYLLKEKTLSVKSVNEILKKIENDKKLSYEEKLIEKLYNEYQDNYCDDIITIKSIKDEMLNKKILLLGPGRSIQDNADIIDEFIKKNNPITVSINFLIELFNIDYIFMSNAKRYSQFFHLIHDDNSKAKLICTSNITEAGMKIEYIVNYSTLLSDNKVIKDNPLIMFLKLLKNININEVWLAGFDGYTQDNNSNYYDDYTRFLYCQDNVFLRNDAIKKEILYLSEYMNIKSITPTKYL